LRWNRLNRERHKVKCELYRSDYCNIWIYPKGATMQTKRIVIMFAALALVLAMAGVSWAVTDTINSNQTKTYEYSNPTTINYKVTAPASGSGILEITLMYDPQPGNPLVKNFKCTLRPSESWEKREINVLRVTFKVDVGPVTVSIAP